MRVTTSISVLGVFLAASPTWAGTIVRHTGDLVSEDMARHTITLDEMEPWHGPGTKPSRHVFHITDGTKAELLTHATNGKADWPGGFTERSLQLSDLRPGEYVTVVVEQEGKQVAATRVEVVRPTSTAAVSQ